ncbi:hypothetical protein E5Q_02269 [Mixia osmundae IAM 14324]|uniref:CHY-type domain-containing protein n=1 Tax=Mixia osmundae (strain CBS 9802 / IAM 14324 / JCM 22182 / KY 12970) TaxID=764103 RepID=G7DYF3_MIXOS|nr:hypothetical protein E5Q_02269 [Mixia osmundae IAM 14324]
MCKHILNAQAAIRAPCCQKWFDCPECHAEKSDHPLLKMSEVVIACKKCKKVFRKDMERLMADPQAEGGAKGEDDADEYCPYCDNKFVLDAKTPAPVIGWEGDDVRMDNRMMKDQRIRQKTAAEVADELLQDMLEDTSVPS